MWSLYTYFFFLPHHQLKSCQISTSSTKIPCTHTSAVCRCSLSTLKNFKKKKIKLVDSCKQMCSVSTAELLRQRKISYQKGGILGRKLVKFYFLFIFVQWLNTKNQSTFAHHFYSRVRANNYNVDGVRRLTLVARGCRPKLIAVSRRCTSQ